MTKEISTDAELISRLVSTQPTPAECLVAAARIEQLRARLARMGITYWLLRSFATHDDSCKLNKPPKFEGPCSCGLAKALTDGESLAALTDGGSNG